MEGWICLQRKFLDWEWYDDPLMVKAFLHLLLKANYEPKKWHGITVQRGQLITGRTQLAAELHISERQVRTILERLKIGQQIDIQTTNKYSLVTICNYAKYQDIPEDERPTNDQQNDQQETNKRPTNDQQTTTTKQYNKETSSIYTPYIPLKGECTPQSEETELHEVEIEDDPISETAERVVFTPALNNNGEKEKSSAKKEKEPKHKYGEFKNVELTDKEAQKLHEEYGDDAVGIVEHLSAYKVEKNYKTKSDYLTIKRWVVSAYYEHQKRQNNGNNGDNGSLRERAERIAEFAFAANGR